MDEQIIGILDSESEDQRLELVLESGETPRLALKLATFSEGLGWHTQKTIFIDARQAEEMQFLLGGAKHLLKQAQQATKRNNLAEVNRKQPAKVAAFSSAKKSA